MPTALGTIASHRTATASGFSPAALPGLLGWWDASDTSTITASGGTISQWRDKSAGARHMNTSAGAPKTGLATQNGLNVVSLTADADQLQYNAGSQTLDVMPWTMFVTVRIPSHIDQRRLMAVLSAPGAPDWGGGSGVLALTLSETVQMYDQGASAAYAVYVPGTWQVWRTIGSSGTWSVAVNGAGGSAAYTPAINLVQIVSVGAAYHPSIIGQVGEVILCNAVLSAPDITATETYLHTKWGIP